jgi:hypothetical protein
MFEAMLVAAWSRSLFAMARLKHRGMDWAIEAMLAHVMNWLRAVQAWEP